MRHYFVDMENIGELIKQELNAQERTVTWFASKLHCGRQNVYDIFARTTIDTALLMRISQVLNKDFFAIYSKQIQEKIKDNDT